MRKIPTVAEEWEEFSKRTMPAVERGSAQWRDMRSSFYAGIFTILQNMLHGPGAHDVSEEQGAEILAGWDAEVKAFFISQHPGSLRERPPGGIN